MRSKLYTFLRVLLVVAVIICAISAQRINTRGSYVKPNAKGVSTTADIVYANGVAAHFDSAKFGSVSIGDVVTLHVKMPEEAPMDIPATLVFYDYCAITEVWYEGKLVDSYGAESAAAGRLIGNHAFFIDIPADAWGKEFTIIVRPTEDHAFSDFAGLKIYASRIASRWYIDKDQNGFIITIAFFIFSIFGGLALVLSGTRGASMRNGLSLALFALLFSLWYISNTMLYGLFRLGGYFWEMLEYIAGFSIPIPLVLFYRGMAGSKTAWGKTFGWAAGVVAVFFAIATALNFTNILHYPALMALAGALLLLCGLLLLTYVFQTRADRSAPKRWLRTGTYILVPTCLYEVFVRVANQYIPTPVIHNMPSLMSIGISFFMMYLCAAYVSDLNERQQNLLVMQTKADTLNKAIDTTPAGICQFIPDGKPTILSANNIFYKIMGYHDEDLRYGKPEDPFVHLFDNERAFLGEKIKEIISSPKNTGEFEFTTVDIDNRPLTIIIRYFYDREDSGNITVNLIDITDRKRMEEELRISEERYKLALSQSGKVFFFFDVPTRTMRLSQELADAFGLPLEVDNMPDNFIAQGLVEESSVDNYCRFYERIFAGDKSGDTIISCHMRQSPEDALWYKIAFSSIFNDKQQPTSAIITYEDIGEQYRAALSSRWKQLNLISVPEKKYVIAVYDLTRNHLLSQTGQLFSRMPAFDSSFDGINAFVIEHFFYEEDREACRAFLNRSRLIERFHSGETEDSIEYRSLQNGSTFRWTSMAASLIEDPYNKHVMAQFLFMDIHEQKSGEIQMQRDMTELQKELENSRIRAMINQMQPHFLYNALSAIQTIVKIDPDYAYQLIYDFTIHLRSSIKALSSDAPIPFENEMENVKAYLNIEKMRFGKKMKVVYDINCEDFFVIPLSIQPLAENAARHGLYPKGEEGGTIWIRSTETPDAYVVEVEDDGEGFDVNQILSRDSDSVGLKNLIFRLKSLMDAEVIINSRIGKGTLVRVTIPKGQKGVASEERSPQKQALHKTVDRTIPAKGGKTH